MASGRSQPPRWRSLSAFSSAAVIGKPRELSLNETLTMTPGRCLPETKRFQRLQQRIEAAVKGTRLATLPQRAGRCARMERRRGRTVLGDLLILGYAATVGFVAGGIVASFYQMVTSEPARFGLLGSGPPGDDDVRSSSAR